MVFYKVGLHIWGKIVLKGEKGNLPRLGLCQKSIPILRRKNSFLPIFQNYHVLGRQIWWEEVLVFLKFSIICNIKT